MDTEHTIKTDEGRPIVYVRPVRTDDLPQDLRDKMEGADTVYAVHSTEGERLALVQERNMAFVLARQNDMEPVTVH